jgi:predicted Zn-dependent protease
MMKASGLRKWILASAVAALPLSLAPGALAQVPVTDAGTAHDANTRVGSGGYNDRRDYYHSTEVIGNRVVTGNVSGGRDFHGAVPYTDPLNFRGNMGSAALDDFIRGSNGVPGPNQGHVIPGQVQAFYGSRMVAPPPAGFAEKGFTGTYTPAPQIQASTGRQTSINAEVGSMGVSLMPPAGDYLISGPQDGQPKFVAGSPLTGMRGYAAVGLSDWTDAARAPNAGFNAMQWETPIERMRMNPTSILQMRQQLLQSISGMRSPFEQNTEEPTMTRPGGFNQNLAKPMETPFESPQNPLLTPKPLENSLNTGPLENAMRIDSAVSNRLTTPLAPGVLPSAAQQSSQYAELQKRLERYYTDRFKTDEQRNREFLQALRAKEAADKAAAEKLAGKTPEPGVGTPSALDTGPDYAKMAQELLNSVRNPQGAGQGEVGVPKPQPMQIESLAAGARGPLSTMLQKAEDLMKAGKYLSAVDEYDLAARVVPNNSLVQLGRANAELAAGYYRKAETDLRDAMGGDPTLMMGRYDLKAMIGQQRLEELVKDLKDVAVRQPDDPAPVLLLAYLAYNTGNEDSAGMYLDQAEKRANSKDVFYRLLKMHWAVPGNESSVAPSAPVNLVLSEAMKQFEDGNVASATLTDETLTGKFRAPIQLPGQKESFKEFKVKLPAGASVGPLPKWLEEHRKDAELKMEISAPATQPAK